MPEQKRPIYVVYDVETGAVVGNHSSVGPDGELRKVTQKEVLSMVAPAVEAALGTSPKLAVLEVDESKLDLSTPMRVDLKGKKLVAAPALRLTADRTEIEGDGEDSIELQVAAVDSSGKPVKSFTGEVQVTTTRGRLSERGGVLELSSGEGKIRLTSAPETVQVVTVGAADPAGVATPGSLDLGFV
jgi:hypothetical protein